MYYSEEIKSRVSSKEAFLHYGIELNRSGFCKCFLTGEKTASLKVYDGERGWHCFGCGANGSVIDFVMQYFNLSFGDAIKKINEDFALGLPIGEKLDRKKQLEIQERALRRKREKEAWKAKKEELDKAYWAAFDEWKRLDDNKRNYAPQTPSEPLHALFVEALKNIDSAEYKLSCAEIVRNLHESRNCRST